MRGATRPGTGPAPASPLGPPVPSEERPLDLPGLRGASRAPYRWGFTAAAGGLLALDLGRGLLVVEHQLLLVVLAAFVAAGLDPVVRLLMKGGLRRPVAVAVIAVVFLGAVVGFVAAAVPPISREATALYRNGPTYLHELHDRHTLLGRLNLQYHVSDRLRSQASGKGVLSAAGGLLHAGTVLISVTFEAVVVAALVIYFLADLPSIKRTFYRLFPRRRRARVALLGDEVLSRVGGYVLGNVLTSIVAIIGNYVVLLALHVPYALFLSVLVGVLDLVPLIGSTVGGAIVALVALATVSATAAVITVVYHVGYRMFEDYVLNPRVMRRTVDVSPAVTIVAVLVGGSLLGITGALLAVPVAAALQLLLAEVVYPKQDAATDPRAGL